MQAHFQGRRCNLFISQLDFADRVVHQKHSSLAGSVTQTAGNKILPTEECD